MKLEITITDTVKFVEYGFNIPFDWTTGFKLQGLQPALRYTDHWAITVGLFPSVFKDSVTVQLVVWAVSRAGSPVPTEPEPFGYYLKQLESYVVEAMADAGYGLVKAARLHAWILEFNRLK